MKNTLSKIMEVASIRCKDHNRLLKVSLIDTPLGQMVAIADEEHLYLLEFVDRLGLESEIERLCIHVKGVIISGSTRTIESVKYELGAYFSGVLQEFKTPFFLLGSDFQKSVWHALTIVPYGETRSYSDQSKFLGKPSAYRAVAHANSTNQLAIIVPCHRIVMSGGKHGGYSGGSARKQWLLDHEKKNRL